MTKPIHEKDLIIIGAGPAGLTAGIYAGRLKLDTLIMENEIVGGQIRDAFVLENYPGYSSISGKDLIDLMSQQAEEAGAIIEEFDPILSFDLASEPKRIETESSTYLAKSVIVASGAKKRLLPIPEESRFHGKQIHYCELCDGHLYEGKHVVVVGGGNSALLAVKVLDKYASKITIVHQLDHFQAEKKVQEEILSNPKVTVLWEHEIQHVIGENSIDAIEVTHLKTHEQSSIQADGIFVYIGYVPGTDIYKDWLNLDANQNILADESTETNLQGVFAAGDIRGKKFRQVTTAVSDGTVAALQAERYIQEHYIRTDSL